MICNTNVEKGTERKKERKMDRDRVSSKLSCKDNRNLLKKVRSVHYPRVVFLTRLSVGKHYSSYIIYIQVFAVQWSVRDFNAPRLVIVTSRATPLLRPIYGANENLHTYTSLLTYIYIYIIRRIIRVNCRRSVVVDMYTRESRIFGNNKTVHQNIARYTPWRPSRIQRNTVA